MTRQFVKPCMAERYTTLAAPAAPPTPPCTPPAGTLPFRVSYQTKTPEQLKTNRECLSCLSMQQ